MGRSKASTSNEGSPQVAPIELPQTFYKIYVKNGVGGRKTRFLKKTLIISAIAIAVLVGAAVGAGIVL